MGKKSLERLNGTYCSGVYALGAPPLRRCERLGSGLRSSPTGLPVHETGPLWYEIVRVEQNELHYVVHMQLLVCGWPRTLLISSTLALLELALLRLLRWPAPMMLPPPLLLLTAAHAGGALLLRGPRRGRS